MDKEKGNIYENISCKKKQMNYVFITKKQMKLEDILEMKETRQKR